MIENGNFHQKRNDAVQICEFIQEVPGADTAYIAVKAQRTRDNDIL